MSLPSESNRSIIIGFLFIWLLASPQSPISAQEAQRYVVEPNHSTIEFSVPIAEGITRVSGKFTKFLIQLSYINDDFTQSEFEAKIAVESINTGIERRDKHLQSATFFDIDQFPNIEFKGKEVVKNGSDYIIKGTLTMHGISKPIEIPFKFKGKTDRYLAFEAKSSLLRSNFEIGTAYEHPGFPNFISDKISFTFSFWLMGPVPDEMYDKVIAQLWGN